MKAQTALLLIDLIDALAVAVLAGTAAKASFDAHIALVKQMVVEDRDPTDDEVAALKSEIASLQSRLHAD